MHWLKLCPGSAIVARDIMSVGIDRKIGFTFPDILFCVTEDTVAEVYDISALTI